MTTESYILVDIWPNVVFWSEFKEFLVLRLTCKEFFTMVETHSGSLVRRYGTLSAFKSLVWFRLKARRASQELVKELGNDMLFDEAPGSYDVFVEHVLQSLLTTGPSLESTHILDSLDFTFEFDLPYEEVKPIVTTAVTKINTELCLDKMWHSKPFGKLKLVLKKKSVV